MKSDDRGQERNAALALDTIVELPPGEATLASRNEAVAAAGPWTGDVAGRYWLRRELGIGGMGRVYEGYDPELQRRVAVKLLHSSFDAEWLSREARALARLSHPNVVAVYDVGTFNGRVFVAMELVEGTTLRQWAAEQPRSLDELLAVALQAGRGLAAAHAAGLLHRDFKPDNVMVGRDGRVRVLDFGIVQPFKPPSSPEASSAADAPLSARDLLESRSERDESGVGAVAGTPAYMAPEQLCGDTVAPAADQFSFCVSLWELVYGQRPFAPEKLLALGFGLGREVVVPQAPSGRSRVPAWLRRVLERGLAIDASARHASMLALLEALEAGRKRAAAESLLLGRRYEILSAASGTTLPGAERALDRFTGRLVTVKRLGLAPEPESPAFQLLAEEFRRCASLRHPDLIGVVDFGVDSEGQAYWVLDLKDEATTLGAVARRDGTGPALQYAVELLPALRYLHKNGILLRGLDPAAIAVVGERAKVAPLRLPLSGTSGHGGSFSEVEADDELLTRLLSRQPSARFQSAEELKQALEAATGHPLDTPSDTRESLLRSAPFLGREEELATLENATREACSGRGAAWLVSGESGVGKSRLLDEISTLGIVHGALVLRGHEQREGGSPYRLFRDVLRGLALLTELDDVEASVLAPVVPNLEKLLGRSLPVAPELDALSTHGRLVEVVKNVVLRQPQPLVLLLEDVQWARSDSLDLLQNLASVAAGSALLIVATARDDTPSLLLDHSKGLRTMRLGRLPRRALERLAEAMIGENARRPGVLELLQRESEGNAFFLVEVVRALAEEAGGVERIGAVPLPERVFAFGVQSVVQQRLRAISGDARSMLSFAAVSGRRLEPRLLQRLMPLADLDDCIAKCIEASVLERAGEELRFRHDKLREGVLAMLPEGESARLHAQVAEAMEAEHAGEPEFYAAIAQHFGEAKNRAKEAHYAGRAGDYALLHGAVREAIELLERSRAWLAEQDDAMALARVCVTLGDAHYMMMDMQRAMASAAQGGAALGVSLPSGPLPQAFALLWQLMLHVVYRLWPRLAPRGSAVERAAMQVASIAAGCAATVKISQSEPLGVLLYSLMAWNWGERAGTRNLWASGVLGYGLTTLGFTGLARSYFESTERGERVLDGSYAVVKTGYLMGLGQLDAAEALMQEGLELAPRTGFYRAEAFRWFLLGYCAYFRGDLEEADKRFALAAANEGARANFAPGLALVRSLKGRVDEAEALLSEGLRVETPAAPRSIALGVLALIHARRGELPAALRSASDAVALAAGGNTFGYAGAAYFAGVFEAYLAELARAQASGESTAVVLRSLRRVLRHCRSWAKAFPIGRPLLLFYEAKQAQLLRQPERARQLWSESRELATGMSTGLYATLAARELDAIG